MKSSISTLAIAVLLSGCNLLAEVAENPDAGVCHSANETCQQSSQCCAGFDCANGRCQFVGSPQGSSSNGGSNGAGATGGSTGRTTGGSTGVGSTTGASSSGTSTGTGGTTGSTICIANYAVCNGQQPCCDGYSCCGDLNTVCVPANQCPGGGTSSGGSSGSTGGATTGGASTGGGTNSGSGGVACGTGTCPAGQSCVEDPANAFAPYCVTAYACANASGCCFTPDLCPGSCMAGSVPQTIVCVSGCSSGQTDCGGLCTNTQTDTQNCGTCGDVCLPGQTCTLGSCQDVATAGLLLAQPVLAVVSTGDQIWAIAGRNLALVNIGTVESYDVPSNQWAYGPSLNDPRDLLAAAVDQSGTIYAIGGYDSSGATGVMETLAAGGSSWQTGASLPTARDGLGAATGLDGTLYAIGGANSGGGYLSTVELYTVGSGWSTGPSMPTARWCPTVVAAQDGRILVMGGKNGGSTSGFSNTDALTTVEAYTPASNSWTTLPSMPAATIEAGAAVASDGKIYVMGGYSDNGLLTTVQVFDPSSNGWSTAANLPQGSDSLAGALGSDGRVYAVAGGNGSLVWAYTESINSWW